MRHMKRKDTHSNPNINYDYLIKQLSRLLNKLFAKKIIGQIY